MYLNFALPRCRVALILHELCWTARAWSHILLSTVRHGSKLFANEDVRRFISQKTFLNDVPISIRNHLKPVVILIKNIHQVIGIIDKEFNGIKSVSSMKPSEKTPRRLFHRCWDSPAARFRSFRDRRRRKASSCRYWFGSLSCRPRVDPHSPSIPALSRHCEPSCGQLHGSGWLSNYR